MRKTINILALVFFIWLVLDTLRIPDLLMNFLIVGAIPGSNITLSPNTMLVLVTLISGVILLELALRHLGGFRNIRYYITHLGAKRERLPKRRFSRI